MKASKYGLRKQNSLFPGAILTLCMCWWGGRGGGGANTRVCPFLLSYFLSAQIKTYRAIPCLWCNALKAVELKQWPGRAGVLQWPLPFQVNGCYCCTIFFLLMQACIIICSLCTICKFFASPSWKCAIACRCKLYKYSKMRISAQSIARSFFSATKGRKEPQEGKGKEEAGKEERYRLSRWLNGRASATFAGVRFPAGAFAIFSVSAKASLPISLSLPLPFLLLSTFRLR